MLTASAVRTPAAGADLALQTLYEFRSNPKNPRAGLVQGNDGNFYGTTALGGTSGENGTVFQFTPSGQLVTLHSFEGPDGALPWAGLVLGRDGLLYGTTQGGGTNGDFGTVFRITTSGDFTLLHSFGGVDGRYPQAALVEGNDGNFYGTTSEGGAGYNGTPGDGTIFRLARDGTFTSLFSFNGTNGRSPTANLIQGRDGNFYGTTSEGGADYKRPTSPGHGTVFRLSPAGSLSNLFSFRGTNGSGPGAGLVEGSDGNFYGTTEFGGSNGDNGTIFRITPTGSFTTVHSFSGADGNYPLAGLVPGRDGHFYGTTSGDRPFGGTNTFGTIFQLTPGGTLTTLFSFDGAGGASPVASLVQGSDGNFYGTAFEGGAGGDGTIFRLVTPPVIAGISASNKVLTLTWTSFSNGSYQLEYKQALTETNWTRLIPEVLSTTDHTSITNSVEGASQRFYRIRLLP